MTSEQQENLLRRLPTDIPGLDAILGGGYFVGGIYMIAGQPGSGKTILGNQICFNHVANKGRALYVTLLTESHARMLAALQSMAFFQPECLGDAMSYISGYQELESENLDGLLKLLRHEMRARQATLLVLDGLVTAADISQSELGLKKFIHELQTLLEFMGCTAVILTGANSTASNYPQRTMVDGILQLTTHRVGMLSVREAEVVKHRGSAHMLGASPYQISDVGIRVFPRAEAASTAAIEPAAFTSERLGTGIKGLDAMLGGGLMGGTTTVLLGPPGAGKTTLGLNFLVAGARRGEAGLYFGFYESPACLRTHAAGAKLALEDMERQNLIHLCWHPTWEDSADALFAELLALVAAKKIKRVFIDGVASIRDSALYPSRVPGLLQAMSNMLRARGVTTVVSDESRNLLSPRIEVPQGGLSAIADNVVLLRYVELRARLRRVVSVMKTRGEAHNTHLREIIIGEKGVEVETSFDDAEMVLSGLAHAIDSGSSSGAPRSDGT